VDQKQEHQIVWPTKQNAEVRLSHPFVFAVIRVEAVAPSKR
jgi:hypothetical protein